MNCTLALSNGHDEARLMAMIAEHDAALVYIATRDHLPTQREDGAS